MNAKITLILPNCFTYSRALDIDCKEPLGILYIASYLRENGYDVDIIDAATYGLSVTQTANLIEESKADIIGFSAVQRTVSVTMEIIKELRKRNNGAHITIGGYLPTLSAGALQCNKDFEKELDSFVIGEGEITFLELAEAISKNEDWKKIKGMAWIQGGKVLYSEPREKITDLDILPFPARDLLPRVLATIGTASIFSSRGCYGNCTFCSQNAFDLKNPGPSWRGRSPKNVVDEIEYLVNKFNVKTIKFNDDNIFGPGKSGKKRIFGICEELKKRNLMVKLMAYCRANDVDIDTMRVMKDAGFERILLGVESTNDEILRKYKKGETFNTIQNAIDVLKEVGMSFIPGYMMFNPYTTVDELRKSIYFLKKNEAYGVTISKTLLVYDSTEIKSLIQKENRLKENNIMEGYHKYEIEKFVGKVYLINKFFWAKYIDPMNRDSKFIVTSLKNRPSFNDRKKWEEVLEKKWLIQADLMEESLNWNKSTDEKEIVKYLEGVLNRFNSLNQYLIKELPHYHNTQYPEYNVGYFCIDNRDLFMDVHTSNIIEANNDLLKRVLFKLMSVADIDRVLEAYRDTFSKEKIEEVRKIVESNFEIREYERPRFPNLNEFTQEVLRILNEEEETLIYENYSWED